MEVAGKFESLSYRELQKAAKSLGLNAGGKKEHIRIRLQNAVAAQQKENAGSEKPKHPAGSTQDTHVVPRKTRNMASSGASPRLLKKALGQISLNSPRANQRLVISSHKNKPLFSPPAASVADRPAIKPSTVATDGNPTSKAVTADAAMQTCDNKVYVETALAVEEETEADAQDERASAAARLLAGEAEQEGGAAVPIATDVVRGRPSMIVATANPRLQETSALPRGTVVCVRLFAEENVPEVVQEEKATEVAESAGNEAKQQQNEGVHDEVAEERPEAIQPPYQKQEENTAVNTAEDVAASSDTAVPPEPAAGGVPSLLSEAEQDKDGEHQHYHQQQGGEKDASVSEESAAEGAGATMPAMQVHPAVTEEQALEVPEAAMAIVSEIPSSYSHMGMGMETAFITVLPSQERGEENDGHAPVALPQQPTEEFVAIEETAAAEHGVGVGDTRRERKGIAVVAPLHARLVIDAETRKLVDESKYLQFADDERSVLCTLTGKKIAPAYDSILLYMGSRKVQQLMVEGPFFMAEYEGMFLVEDPADDGFVFSELTGVRIFKSKAAVDQHINSQPFREMMAILSAKLNV